MRSNYLEHDILKSSNLVSPTNQLLAVLPPEAYQRLLPSLKLVELPQHKILYHPGENYQYAYFPSRSVISIVTVMENGSMAEIGVIGNEGMIGLPIFLHTNYTNFTVIVQVGGEAYRIARQPLQAEIDRNGALQDLLRHYVQARIVQLSQTAACNSHHKIEQRFARWLLTVRDSIQAEEFQLTQEFISQMLGVRRSGVTVIASQFQKAGIIQYKRGKIWIVSHQKLEAACCECHQIITNEYSRLLARQSDRQIAGYS